MRRVYRSADKEIDVGGFLEEQAADERRAVLLVAPLLVGLIVSEVILCVFENLIYRDDALGDEVDSLYLCDRRDIASLEVKRRLERLAEVFRGNGGRCASADDVLALL